MRLGVLLPPLVGPEAGLAVYVRELVSRLLALEPSTLLFTEQRAPLPEWCSRAEVVHLGEGLAIRVAARLHPRLARLLAVQLVLRRQLRQTSPDALLVPFHDGVYRCPVPQGVVIHDLTLLRHPPPGSLPAVLYTRLLVRRVVRSSAVRIAVSSATRTDLEHFWGLDPARVTVIPEGYDQTCFRAFDDSEISRTLARHQVRPPYLFYAGTLQPHKNLPTAVAALRELAPSWPELSLVIAGPAEAGAASRLTARLRRSEPEPRVRFLGYVERRDLGPLMAGAVAFVFPSRHEGFGLSVLEAMASGAAVLAADRASLPEVVGDGGLLLDPDRPADWARAIESLLESPARRRDLGRAGLARAASFDWETTAQRTLDLLRSVASSGGGEPRS